MTRHAKCEAGPARRGAHVAVRFAVIAALLPGPAGAAEVAGATPEPEARVATVGWRLATAGLGWCDRPIHAAGLALHDPSQYAVPTRVAAPFHGRPEPLVLAVARDGPADRAGLRAGNRIIAVNDVPPPGATTDREPRFDRIEQLLDQIDRAAADGPLRLTVERDDQRSTAVVNTAAACPTRFELGGPRGMSAYADGRYVIVSAPAVRFAADDGELAAIMAHELAHNILGHPAIARGAGAATVRARELEADRLSVALLRCAGYDPRAAITFWTRFARRDVFGFLRSHTHPSSAERIAVLQKLPSDDRCASKKD